MGSEVSTSWQTASVPSADRYAAWEDMLRNVYGSWQPGRAPGESFDAAMVHHSIGGFQIVDCLCDPCEATRTRADISKDGKEALTIQLVLSGREHFTIDEKRIALGAGDVLIWNTLQPMQFEVVEKLRKLSVTMPLHRVRSWLPNSWHSIESNLPHFSPGAEFLAQFISAMSPAFLAGKLPDSDALTESLMGVLVNVVGDRDPGPVGLRETQLDLVKRYISANLSDPALDPESIAAARRISLRYLHALFEDEPDTVQQHIILERLHRCRRDLGNPKMAARTITDIAFSWGFQNATHFSRRFKAEYGLSPHDYRAACQG